MNKSRGTKVEGREQRIGLRANLLDFGPSHPSLVPGHIL